MPMPARASDAPEAAPVVQYLSKKTREKLALERRMKKVDAAAGGGGAAAGGGGHGGGAAGGGANHQQQHQQHSRGEREREPTYTPHVSSIDAQALRQQYLGEKVQKISRKPSDKFRFKFDWDESEDTTKGANALYANPHEARLMFGRGRLAGNIEPGQTQSRPHDQRGGRARHDEPRRLPGYGNHDKRRDPNPVRDQRRERERDRRFDNRRRDGHRDRSRSRSPPRTDARQGAGGGGGGGGASSSRYDLQESSGPSASHWSTKSLEDMKERDWRIFLEDFSIQFKTGGRPANPLRDWSEALQHGLPPTLLNTLKEVGYHQPSPIQRATIPLGLVGRDVLGLAQTGSGKTAAFVLPMLAYIHNKCPKMRGNPDIEAEGPYAIVMAPTRELVQQIDVEAQRFARAMDYRVVPIVGGVSIEDQGYHLRNGCEVIIATPGRMADCLDRRYAVLNQCNYVVLDEADRMIDMGFEPQVMTVLDALPSSSMKAEDEGQDDTSRVLRTTHMFSATMPPQVERLARKYLRRPSVVNIGDTGRVAELITQVVKQVDRNETQRNAQLIDTLNQYIGRQRDPSGNLQAVVFVNHKKNIESVARALDQNPFFRAVVLHSGKSQDVRTESLQRFRDKKANVLVGTDVVARGIDVPNVSLVVNYNMANDIETYTHRIGRTGRAGKSGTAVTFLGPSDTHVYYDLKKLLVENQQTI
ncbi:hypothetical protein PPROV_000332300 [Pycnococcus provasolii]|uniref:RNA helicase n=2 Tax=Pycnococcus provasolii TaxID=41880 RepID=A0A830HGV9_9CHLO|nr:hypothetical protein PPROV_000332300 [Pycnococcus provasolii]